MFWRRATADAAAATMIAGSLCGFGLFLMNVVFGWTHLHFLYAAPLLTLIDLAIMAAVSLRRPVTLDAAREETMWQAKFSRGENLRLRKVPIWQDYRFLAAGLLALTAGIVISFR